MIVWPESIVSDVARRKSVIFLGSGISRNSKNAQGVSPKTWHEFLSQAAGQLGARREIIKALGRNDYLTACEMLKHELGQDNFHSLLIDEFLTPEFPPSEYHRAIFRLDSRIVATPNFDKIYETYANAERMASVRVKNHCDGDVADALRRDDRLILKVHGSIDTPNKMIFTRKEYAEARSKYGSFYTILNALALTHTFLFIGCGLSDPDIRLLLEDIFFHHEVSRPHVFVLPQKSVGSREMRIVEDTMNLNLLTYNPLDGHRLLLESLNGLVSKVEVERAKLKITGNW